MCHVTHINKMQLDIRSITLVHMNFFIFFNLFCFQVKRKLTSKVLLKYEKSKAALRRKLVALKKVCCSVLQCVAVCCSVLQCVAVCCSVLQCVAVCCSKLQQVAV